jgi:hypothetical protein
VCRSKLAHQAQALLGGGREQQAQTGQGEPTSEVAGAGLEARMTSTQWAMRLAVAMLAAGCGRKATVDDCQLIVKRIVELELQGVVPEQELGSEVAEAQQAFRERALADCVGRRITEKSLACVAAATSAETVIDECFD